MSIFTVEETKKIIMNTVQGMGEASEEQIQQVVDWCILQRTGNYLVQLLIDGQILVTGINNGEPLFILKKLLEVKNGR